MTGSAVKSAQTDETSTSGDDFSKRPGPRRSRCRGSAGEVLPGRPSGLGRQPASLHRCRRWGGDRAVRRQRQAVEAGVAGDAGQSAVTMTGIASPAFHRWRGPRYARLTVAGVRVPW